MVRYFANFSLCVWMLSMVILMGYLFTCTTQEIRAFSDSYYWTFPPLFICGILVMSYAIGSEQGGCK